MSDFSKFTYPPKILFRESLAEEKELESASKYFTVLDSRVKVQKGDLIIPRYSVVPFAKEFFDDMNYIGAETLNSYHQYLYIADIKNYIQDLGNLTFKTWRAADGFYNLPDNCSFVLKGETNSKKFEWKEMMFAKDKSSIQEIHSKLSRDGLIGDQEIYIREYVPLKQFATSFKDLPITNEYRFFVVNKQVISSGYYWTNYYETLIEQGHNLDPSQVPLDLLQQVIDRVGDNCYAYVIDVGETQDGKWIVIELNAFEQSGLSENDPDLLYCNLSKLFENTVNSQG
jgi:hypothetical protein